MGKLVKRTSSRMASRLTKEEAMGKKDNKPTEGRELILKAGKMITNRIPIAL